MLAPPVLAAVSAPPVLMAVSAPPVLVAVLALPMLVAVLALLVVRRGEIPAMILSPPLAARHSAQVAGRPRPHTPTKQVQTHTPAQRKGRHVYD